MTSPTHPPQDFNQLIDSIQTTSLIAQSKAIRTPWSGNSLVQCNQSVRPIFQSALNAILVAVNHIEPVAIDAFLPTPATITIYKRSDYDLANTDSPTYIGLVRLITDSTRQRR